MVTLRLSLLLQRPPGKSPTVGTELYHYDLAFERFERLSGETSAAKGGCWYTIQLLPESLYRMVVTLLFMKPNLTTWVVSTP